MKAKFFRGICISWVAAVVAHTLNLQSEAILITRACGGDAGRAARVVSNSNALAGILGIIVNQFGGRLSDSFGRAFFYKLGPLAQIVAGAMAFARPDSAAVLATSKALRKVFTTFSGTVMGGAGMRDVFDAASGELRNKSLEAKSMIGLGLMMGPLLEAMILKRVGVGGERLTYLLLSVLGAFSLGVNTLLMPETLSKAKRTAFNWAAALQSANPFGFMKIYTDGSPALKKLATITTLQSTTDGKTMSDLSQIWMREHLKLSITSIRNFIMGFGMASALSADLVTKPLTMKLSVYGFTTVTNLTNFVAFALRGAAESPLLFFGMLPVMLPGVNGNSSEALHPIVSELTVAAGFGKGESSAWLNNLRELAGAAATFLYGHFYAWCQERGLFPGHTYAVAGLLGAALPQAILMLAVEPSELRCGRAA